MWEGLILMVVCEDGYFVEKILLNIRDMVLCNDVLF